ncbi:MAG: metal ABC transporter ATP-binding protein [Kaiparowitsia implicata GSE-PSE-MK54-09C]|jgi:manganese/iron transport system ATP-binding protein|nr:metal ABC transporter ATP-binding protein [Kaiparowitsia implicata GSE-PSE-MK54-09C]
MLKVHNLSVNYRGTEALNSVSLAIHAGELVGLIGPNGAGKSTLLKALLGLVAMHAGQVLFEERPLVHQRQRVAYVPQRSQIDWDYPVTAWNVVMMARTVRTGWLRSPNPRSRQAVEAAMQRLGVWDLRDRQIGELSGGQQQRVFLARAIAQDADLFFFDEPFNAIDKTTEAVILDLLAELKAHDKTVLVCSHEWGQALNRYDRLLLLNQRLVADGDPQQVMTLDNIQRAYGENLQPSERPAEMPFFC